MFHYQPDSHSPPRDAYLIVRYTGGLLNKMRMNPVRAPTSMRHQHRRREPRATTTAVERATARSHSHVRGCRSVVSHRTSHARAQARLLVLPVMCVVLN